jgi:hypothetical protein
VRLESRVEHPVGYVGLHGGVTDLGEVANAFSNTAGDLSVRPPRLQYGMGFAAMRGPVGLVLSSTLDAGT